MLYRIYLLSIGLLFITYCSAQKYFPFPTENVHWNIHFESGPWGYMPDTSLLRYTLGEDSVVNSVSYIQLIEEVGDTANPYSRVVGLLVERDKKIYYKGSGVLGCPGYDSILLYDFTKNIGDTIIHSQTEYIHSILLNVDSVLVGEEYRKRYQVDCSRNYVHAPTDYWIEGIGSVLNGPIGFISDVPTANVFWEFVCYHDQTVEYVNPRFESCYPDYFFMGIDNVPNPKSETLLYPNPCKNVIYFNNGQPVNGVNYSVCIFDIVGNLVLMEDVEKPSVKVNQLTPGMYVLEVNTGSEIHKHKFLKEDAD